MTTAIAAAFDAVSYGAIMVLVVLGLGIVASMMRIYNFAHGEFMLLGACTLYLAPIVGLPIWAGVIVAPFAVALVGLGAERLAVRRFYSQPVTAMLTTYALALLIRETVRGTTGGRFLSVAAPISGTMNVGGVELSLWRIAIIAITCVVVATSYAILMRTYLGLWIRAALDNPTLARASGIPTGFVYAGTFAFGAGLAGLAGALIVPLYTLNADLGVRFLLIGFLAVMIGGAGSFAGTLIGGAVIGVISALLPWIISPVVTDLLVFVAAIAFTKSRPRGLLGTGSLNA
ncbi:branched-chain amino acid ABC transporter permease [Chelatococcus asaccharovorans]|uniref:Amino acid/amide ABC transporter membrane protein 1 (HAAT family) n=1 Tax=Chelatococcus asaccharovorans TaxID=28210 RepID=A0A2V3U8M6_9HYPH|nr:branched-chain amino acid ABC transporter permease [Chelatococcus asaccharovorans]MBS7706037.1 branched-chain amino acid ABC transporter permease [Chelatococcus asaccharovorans]PXW59060.1 amino acid/amide ABC transporter membrane protein 1 (HAAT family) [Chelatococcus asaccharovorans]CAH1659648.1 Amino acid/amide ABC transporter membrane protein 1 (HAAT family) [Chelatococcus asaccharovorans]CAH1684113.1 Amino acid/amide ABC transporter membrane protein 1 (HAAT family) [Chelatococcus asaccha